MGICLYDKAYTQEVVGHALTGQYPHGLPQIRQRQPNESNLTSRGLHLIHLPQSGNHRE